MGSDAVAERCGCGAMRLRSDAGARRRRYAELEAELDKERIDALDQILAKKLAKQAAEKDAVIAEKEDEKQAVLTKLAGKDAEIAALKTQLGKA